MNKSTKISVLMAVYNTDFSLIKRAIDSVLSQSFQDFELIIIDDGSHNGTQNLLVSYAKKHEDKIIYMRHANCGQAASINRGILNSRGEYITIIDGDDEYKPQHLENCLKEMAFVDLIASKTETIVDDPDDCYVPDQYDQKQLIHVDDCILFATLFGKKEVFATIKFQEKYAADAEFYERASRKYRVKKVNFRSYIYYRNIPNSKCATIKKQNLLELAN
jgi:glycosyltransferase involved in cell wall biosynthesis